MADSANEATRLLDSLEKLSEGLVLADVSDQESLAELRGAVDEVLGHATDDTPKVARDALHAMIEIVDGLAGGGTSEPDDPRTDILNGAVSALQQLIRDGRPPEQVVFPEGLLGPVEAMGVSSPLPPGVDETILAEFLARQTGNLDSIQNLILSLERDDHEEALGELRRDIHTLKGESGLLGMGEVSQLCHAIEDALDAFPPSELADVLLRAKDWLAEAFKARADGESTPSPIEKVLGELSSPRPTEGTDGNDHDSNPAPADERVGAGASEPQPPAAEAALAEPLEFSFEDDVELLGDFITEASEHLEASDIHLLTVETDPANEDALNAVFRAFHTIKGNAGFLGLDQMRWVAHESENVLDKARKGQLILTGGAVDVIFESVDLLKRQLVDLRAAIDAGEKLSDDPLAAGLVERLQTVVNAELAPAGAPADTPPCETDKKLGEMLIESGAANPEDVKAALALQEEPPCQKPLGQLLVENAATSSRNVAEALEAQAQAPDSGKLGAIMAQLDMATPEDIDLALKQQQQPPATPKLGSTLVRKGKAAAKDVAQALRNQKGSTAGAATRAAVQVRETIKVDAQRLDDLVDMIGELVIAESMASQLASASSTESSQLGSVMGQLDKITRELQETGMSLRMIPVRSTFQKMARLVRDVAKKTNKNVDFVLSGEDTELDKIVVEKISDPLVHMVRNAVDHGIEDPADRLRAGKSATGRIELRAYHKGGNVYIEIEDDGGGLDVERILTKARARGAVGENAELTDREVYNLIFEPGFSTASEVTDVSGRGVGLDVVRRGIEALHGKAEIRSEPGRGCVFSIRLPLTLAIIDGMLVTVGAERFIIPTLSITRLIRPRDEDIRTVLGRGEMIGIGGHLIPLFRVHELFNVAGAQVEPAKALAIVVESDGCQVALLVDETLGQQQIVIKSLGEMFLGIQGISGGAILPDGQVGLIMDVGGVVDSARHISKELVEATE